MNFVKWSILTIIFCMGCLHDHTYAQQQPTLVRVCEATTSGGETYGHAFWFAETLGRDYVFDGDGRLEEYSDGTARLTGTIVRRSDTSKSFTVDVTFSEKILPGDANYPPTGSPKNDPSGVDTSTWTYYAKFQGTLTGLGVYVGKVLTIDRKGPAFQVGDGGSIHTTDFGAASWFTSQPGNEQTPFCPNGDINVRLDCQDVDCLGIPGGTADKDSCGVCDGNNRDKGCDGVCFSNKVYDSCQVCDGPGPGECGCDLQITKDVCGVCDGSGKNECGICLNLLPDTEDPLACYDCEGTPYGNKVKDPNGSCCDITDLDECGVCNGPGKDDCGVCGGDNTTCLDCLDVVNGDSKLDDCGVCDGGNTTCKCSDVDVPVDIDTVAHKQLALVTKYVRKYIRNAKRAGTLTKIKKAKKDLQTATAQMERIWAIVWVDFGRTVLVCDNSTSCTNEDTSGLITEIADNTAGLFGLTKKYIRRTVTNKARGKKITNAQSHVKATENLLTQLPTVKSICE